MVGNADAEYIEKVYNRYSRFYDLIFGRVFQSGREMAPLLLDLAPDSNLLEVGVGTGLSIPLLPRNIHITGVDLSEKMLERASRRMKQLKFNDVQLIRMDAGHLGFPSDSFDRILAAYFISTVPDAVKVIEEMKRVCKPNGYLLFLNHFRNENPFLGRLETLASPFFHRIGFRTDLGLHELMEECDLEIDSETPIDFLGHWRAVRCINP